jgi:hypothetical protein
MKAILSIAHNETEPQKESYDVSVLYSPSKARRAMRVCTLSIAKAHKHGHPGFNHVRCFRTFEY